MLIEQLQKYMIIIVYTHREQPRLHTYVHRLLLPYERGKLDDRVKVLRWKVQPNPWSHSRRRQNERQIVETYHNFEVNEDSAAAAVRRSPPCAKTAVAVLFSPRTWHPGRLFATLHMGRAGLLCGLCWFLISQINPVGDAARTFLGHCLSNVRRTGSLSLRKSKTTLARRMASWRAML